MRSRLQFNTIVYFMTQPSWYNDLRIRKSDDYVYESKRCYLPLYVVIIVHFKGIV